MDIPTPSLPKTSQTRDEIIRAAYDLFLQQGYHGTSMRQIAAQAGAALGGIYNHFTSKEAIFVAVLDAHHPYHKLIPILEAAPSSSLEDFVRTGAFQILQELKETPEFLNLIFIELVEFKGNHIPLIFAQAAPPLMALFGRFADSQEQLRPVSLSLVIRSFFGMLISYALTEQIMVVRLPVNQGEDVLEGMLDIYLHGILAGE